MFFVLIWIAAAAGVGAIAQSKNRSFWGFMFASLFFSPVIGLIAILVSKAGGRPCPACAETVKSEAKKCRHCGADLPAEPKKKGDELDGVANW